MIIPPHHIKKNIVGGNPWPGRAFPWLVNFLVIGYNFIFREMIGVCNGHFIQFPLDLIEDSNGED
jgi:hypothetical protein